MRTLQNSSTRRRHTGILPGALEGPMKRGALRLRKCPWSTPNTAAMLSLATSWLAWELLVGRDHIFPSCLIRVLGECCDSNRLSFPRVHLVFPSRYVFLHTVPSGRNAFPVPLNIHILPICRPLILWTPLLGIFPGPHLFPRQWWLPLYLSRLFMRIRTDRYIFSSVTRLQTSGGKGPGFTHLPVLQAQRHVFARLPVRTAISAMIRTVCARLHLLFEPANDLSDRY